MDTEKTIDSRNPPAAGKDDMNEQLHELLELLRRKHPAERYDGYVKLLFYDGGGGYICEGPHKEGNILFDFSDPDELIAHLTSPDVEEPEHLEEGKNE